MTPQYPKRESVKKEIRTTVKAYIDAITVLGRLKKHLDNIGIKCHIEQKMDKKEGGFKTPDLLICSKKYIIVDHKYTESTNKKTITDIIEDIKKYDTTFIYESYEFKPEIVILVDEKITKLFGGILECPIIWGYNLDGDITISQSIGSVKDSKISSLFRPNLYIPMSIEAAKYRFIISHSPLPYTACQVNTLLWTLLPPDGYYSDEFDVDYDVILKDFNNLFPAWISPGVQQLTDTRLKEALDFLKKIGWIKWLKPEKKIIFFRNKGRLQGDILEYFIEKCTEFEYRRRLRKYEKQIKLSKKNVNQKLSDFY